MRKVCAVALLSVLVFGLPATGSEARQMKHGVCEDKLFSSQHRFFDGLGHLGPDYHDWLPTRCDNGAHPPGGIE